MRLACSLYTRKYQLLKTSANRSVPRCWRQRNSHLLLCFTWRETECRVVTCDEDKRFVKETAADMQGDTEK